MAMRALTFIHSDLRSALVTTCTVPSILVSVSVESLFYVPEGFAVSFVRLADSDHVHPLIIQLLDHRITLCLCAELWIAAYLWQITRAAPWRTGMAF